MKRVVLFTIIFIAFLSAANAKWQLVPNTNNYVCLGIAASGENLIAATPNGVVLSSDNGRSWYVRSNELDKEYIHCIQINNGIAFVGTETGVFSSTDMGASWVKVGSGYFSAYAICFAGGNIIAGAYGAGVYAKPLASGDWISISNGMGSPSIKDIVSFNGFLYCATEAKVYRANQNSFAWSAASIGLDQVSVNRFFVDDNGLYAGTMMDGVYAFDSQSAHWTQKADLAEFCEITQGLSYQGKMIVTSSAGGIGIIVGNSIELRNGELERNYVMSAIIVGNNILIGTTKGIYSQNIDEFLAPNPVTENGNLDNSYFFPNPTTDMINCRTEAEAGTRYNVVVTDLLGNAVQSSEFESCPAELRISLSGLAAGSYCVTAYSNGKKVKSELVIKY